MITYNEWGDAQDCTHEHDGRDVDPGTANELERVITESVISLRDRIRYLEGREGELVAHAAELAKDLPELRQRLRIAHAFIRWVVQISEGGPRVELEYLKRRADRALLGFERMDSNPPRRPLDT